MNVYLGEHYEEFIRKQVATGKYASAAEVMREALRDLETKKQHARVRELIEEARVDVANGNVVEMTPDFWEKIEQESDNDERLGIPIPDHVKY
jgi:antitoxin ParD1/3/4